MVRKQVGQRTPFCTITNTAALNNDVFLTPKRQLDDNYIEDCENRVLIEKDSSINNDSFDGNGLDQVLINLEDSSSSSCGLNNSSSINITSSTINSSISSNNSNKTQKLKKRVQFISNEALDKTKLTYISSSSNKYTTKLNSLPVNDHNRTNKYTSKLPINQHQRLTKLTKPLISYSNTMPSISSILTNQYSQLKTNMSDYTILYVFFIYFYHLTNLYY
ncbi:unnamed protein product [Brachionus calyciflorus]|uniref:Uncharacterized protein n=1 Tax=Brachionus calyciflorus TaxID=104777 RepID=A0A813M7Z6_9BILA|nr:unnamed protein product [Brachionus calyciflorus]